jgi:hypothetical protein
MSQVKVLLTGGPNYFPEDARVHHVTDLSDVVKLPFGIGYQHFVYSGTSTVLGAETLAEYHWTGQTKVAE